MTFQLKYKMLHGVFLLVKWSFAKVNVREKIIYLRK